MGAESFGGLLAYMIAAIILIAIFSGPIKLLAGIFTGISEGSTINNSNLAKYKYRGFATLAGGNHPKLGSVSKKVILAIRKSKLFVLNKDESTITSTPIKNVKAETISISAATSANLFLFGIMNLGAKEQLLQLEIYDEKSKETYKSLFKDTGFSPDWINKERYNYLVQENENIPSQA